TPAGNAYKDRIRPRADVLAAQHGLRAIPREEPRQPRRAGCLFDGQVGLRLARGVEDLVEDRVDVLDLELVAQVRGDLVARLALMSQVDRHEPRAGGVAGEVLGRE